MAIISAEVEVQKIDTGMYGPGVTEITDRRVLEMPEYWGDVAQNRKSTSGESLARPPGCF